MKLKILIFQVIILSACSMAKQKPQEEINSIPPLEVELVLNTEARLGEGAIWNHKNKMLYWVDIENGDLNIFDPAVNINRTLNMAQRIGTVVPIDTGGVILGLQNGVFTLNELTEEITPVAYPEEGITDNRLNDGKCDPAGRFWVGSMSLNVTPHAASLYRISGDYTFAKMIDNVTISNGIAWSVNGEIMYYIDTPTREVKSYDFNLETGEIQNPKVCIAIPDSLGFPDGCTIDAEGKLWIAMWGGACVTRWNPENGKLLQLIKVPAKNVTSVAFGGENLDVLYITSARNGLNTTDLQNYPNSGALFSVKPGVKGVKANFFKSSH